MMQRYILWNFEGFPEKIGWCHIPRDPGSPSQNGFMEPQILPKSPQLSATL